MVCSGCYNPQKQVKLRSPSLKNMTKGQAQETLSVIKFKPLSEVQKHIKSDTCYLHFSTIEGAAYFFNSYNEKGINLNNLQFTVNPMQFPNGTVVRYPTTAPTPTHKTTHTPTQTPTQTSTQNQVAAAATTSTSDEWKLSTKRAIEDLDQEIKRISSSIWREL
ncbi:uncharacterized protein EV154DRAFT_63825 [Mucor mucedo]|uniref:uncharacterized protein n=1 Tax=Mucor mucedo TaxID=29922 RepID=UPI002220D77B|nr:uncharacterized protein EV154DRAFT_63825 [Mucor mucedo]KAI7876792.1 hypothetical protein EV154DRAFT_63825 [Mucor mucedo]